MARTQRRSARAEKSGPRRQAQSETPDGDKPGAQKPGQGKAHPEEASPWEWVVAGLGALLVAASIGYLAYFAQTAPEGPPVVQLETGAVHPSGAGYLVTVIVTNPGGETAASVGIEGTLRRDGAVLESATATLDYVPRFSTRHAGLYFENDPREAVLDLRPLGYTEP